jgi:hypothetical protein
MAQDKVVIDIVSKDQTSKGIKKAENSFKKMAKTLGPLIAVGFGVAAIKNATDAYIRQENAIAQLDARLKSTGNAVGIASKELQGMAASLQQVTTFGDEAIIEMQALLLTFTRIGGETFPQATEAILNVSTAMGQDLKSSAVQVGKALNDPIKGITALGRTGIQFTDTQKDMIKTLQESGDLIGAQTIILKELETQFGGAARAARNTLGGALTALANTIGDEVFEALGKGGTGFIPLIQELERIITSDAFKSGMEGLAGGFSAIGSALGTVATGFGDASEFFDFLESDVVMSAIPGLNLLAIASGINAINDAASGTTELFELDAPAGRGGNARQTDVATADMRQLAIDEAADLLDIQREAGIEASVQQQAIDDRRSQQLQMLIAANAEQYDIDVQNKKDAADLKAANDQLAMDVTMTALSDLGSLMNTESRKAFEIGKVASIANTIIKTYEGAQNAFASGSKINIAFGVAAAAAAVVAGLANVQAIQSQTFGGGGGGSPSVPNIPSSGLGPQGPTVTQPQITTIDEPGGAPVEVRTASILGAFAEELMPAMVEAQRRGVPLVIT